jgi:hypothetical protein
LYRLHGELLLAQASTPPPWQAAEESLQKALTLARQLLAMVYAWFTEGLDTADLQEAQALLEELA